MLRRSNRCGRRRICGLLFSALIITAGCWCGLPRADAADSRLLRLLTGRNEAIRMRAVASVDPLRQQELLPDLISAAHAHVEEIGETEIVRPSSVALLYQIGKFQDDAAEALLIELLDCSHVGFSMIAADTLGVNKRYGAIDALKKQVARPAFSENYAYRFNLVRTLASMEHPDAVQFLTELEPSLDGQLRYKLHELLQEVTVSHFHGDREAFETWQEKRRATTTKSGFFTAGFRPESIERIEFGPQKYYGIDIHARRLMFILDHSGSMQDYYNGTTRLDRAKFELVKAIDQLPEQSEFAILFYATSVRTWRSELVPATEKNKKEAIQFVQRLGYGDKTNTYAALREALDFDSELEAVFLLSDGRPTVGPIIAPAKIVQDILHRNRFRHLNFNTIGVAVGGQTEAFLKTLAVQSGGEFRTAN